jgi:hypothetical protein
MIGCRTGARCGCAHRVVRIGAREHRPYIATMVERRDPKDRYDFARLLTQIEALRNRTVQELAKRLPPDQHKRVVDSLRDVLNKLTSRKN